MVRCPRGGGWPSTQLRHKSGDAAAGCGATDALELELLRPFQRVHLERLRADKHVDELLWYTVQLDLGDDFALLDLDGVRRLSVHHC